MGIVIPLPAEIEQVFYQFRTAEFSTLAKDNTPIAWPVVTVYEPEYGQFLMTTSIALPNKAYNIRRNAKVSMLFSEPRASTISDPPAVLVQGEASVSQDVKADTRGAEKFWQRIYEIQPDSTMFNSNRLMRWLFDWYYMRLLIRVTPHQIVSWPHADFSQKPEVIYHVG